MWEKDAHHGLQIKFQMKNATFQRNFSKYFPDSHDDGLLRNVDERLTCSIT